MLFQNFSKYFAEVNYCRGIGEHGLTQTDQLLTSYADANIQLMLLNLQFKLALHCAILFQTIALPLTFV